MAATKKHRCWDTSLFKDRFRLQLGIGLHPPDVDDYFPGMWSFNVVFFGMTFTVYTWLEEVEDGSTRSQQE